MLTKRLGLTLAAVGGLVLLLSSPTWADPDFLYGQAECGSGGGPGCDVSAESERGGQGSPGAPSDDGDPGTGGGTGVPLTGGGTTEPECATAEDEELVGCLALPQTETEDAELADVVDLEALAYRARASFALDAPEISMSPSAEAPVLVQVPVWLSVDADDWQAETATASVPGGSVTVTATPSLVSWDMGDGQSVDCEGPGTAYEASEHDPAAASPDCGHTYTSTSGGSVDVTASMSWSVEWETSTGEGGTLPDLTTETSTTVQVVESSSLVTTTR